MKETYKINTFTNHADRLAYVLIKFGAMGTNRPKKYEAATVIVETIDLENALDYEPRYLAPLIVLLVQHPKFLTQFKNIPEDIYNTVAKIRAGNKLGEDCRYEAFKNLVSLCGIIKDGRVKGPNKKVRKQYRFDQAIAKKLDELMASGGFDNETQLIEKLISKA